MQQFYPDPAPRLGLLSRKPQRITATLHWGLCQYLQRRADVEGRSLSNLICHLLEAAQAADKG